MLGQLERFALAAIQAAATARALGSPAPVPDWAEIRADFDTALAAEPQRVDQAEQAMLVAIGLRG